MKARRDLQTRNLTIALLLLALGVTGSVLPQTPRFDIVIIGGRVMDPESGLDAVRNVGIQNGRIAAITSQDISGSRTIDASGLIVTAGFIDLHAHGQDPVSAPLQVADGVTTALEMEIGVFPVGQFLESRKGRALTHYGATVGHLPARIKLFTGIDIVHTATLEPGDDRMKERDFGYKATSASELQELSGLMKKGLREGGLGFGFGITYTPAASRLEVLRLWQLAANEGAPVFVHLRGARSGGTLGAFQEAIANAASTGASVHIVHMNSSADESARVTLEMIRGARKRGVDVTTESYPYTAGSTLIESALFDSWVDGPEEAFQRLQWAATGERLNAATFKKYRAQGGWVIIHGRREETNEWIVAQPDVMVASDGIPFLFGPAHPRGAGTYARVLGHYVRERRALTLMEALAKSALLPARRLEQFAPIFNNKGRLRAGADADVTVFDPDTVIDRSSYEKGDVPSGGIIHVLVAGTPVVADAKVLPGVFPGEALRGGGWRP